MIYDAIKRSTYPVWYRASLHGEGQLAQQVGLLKERPRSIDGKGAGRLDVRVGLVFLWLPFLDRHSRSNADGREQIRVLDNGGRALHEAHLPRG